MEMPYGITRRSSGFSAVGKGSGNADCAERIQSVRILNDLSFQCRGCLSSILTERNCADNFTDCPDRFILDPMLARKASSVCMVLSVEQLMIICIVQERS